jgi:hypothetical protein
VEYDTKDGRTMMRLASSTRKTKDEMLLSERVLPSPITTSGPYRFCIRTSFGSFKDYTSRSLLHAGVSNSKGVVYNFDERGHHRDERWIECVSTPLNDIEDFDRKLNEYDASHRSRVHTYSHRIYREEDEMEHPGNNCFDYVVGFLNYVRYKGRNDHTVQSIERYLLTRPMMDAQAYINQWRALKRANGNPLVVASSKDVVKHPHPLRRIEGDPRAWSCDGCDVVTAGGIRYRCVNGCDFDLCEVGQFILCVFVCADFIFIDSYLHSQRCRRKAERPSDKTTSKKKDKEALDLITEKEDHTKEEEEDDDKDDGIVDVTTRKCRGGCGFYGSQERKGFCSVCWKKQNV